METEILTVEELRSYLKIPKPTVYALAQSGRIPGVKIGKHWRFRRSDIDEWMKAHQQSAQLKESKVESTDGKQR